MQIRKSKIEIPPQVEWIFKKLNTNGFQAYAVGGCVRDTLIGREPEDWDITTSAKPEQVKAIFGKTIDTGLQHGTVTVMLDGTGYEVTTYRIDGEYEDGRHPKSVAFTADIKEDLRRRDFTINAMAYSHKSGIVDISGGVEDLKNGIVRSVGDARERFSEDALRILRAIRFSAQLGFAIEDKTYHAIRAIAPNLIHVSKERIQVELTKLLTSPHPEKILLVYESGISPYISPAFHKIIDTKRPQPDHTELQSIIKSHQPPAKKSLRYSAFLRFTTEENGIKTLKDLKMDNDTIARAKVLLHWLPEPLSEEKASIRRTMSQMPDELFDDMLKLKKAIYPEKLTHLEQIEQKSDEIRKQRDCIRLGDLAITGHDLIAAGIKPGKEIGKALNTLFEAVMERPELNKKEKLLDIINQCEKQTNTPPV